MWQRLKQIFDQEAQLPTIQDRNEVLRIFYSFRIGQEAHVNYLEVAKKNWRITYLNKKPVMSPGTRGTFDDCGVMPSCLVDNQLYYTGWTKRQKTPYTQAIGSAIFDERKNRFIKNGPPILTTTYLANSPFVIGKKMWFCNGTGWTGDKPTYQICRATYNKSWCVDNGFQPLGNAKSMNSRPFVRGRNIYFAKKTVNGNYSIYMNNEKILGPGKDWDSEMVCYPYLIGSFMFYNGNGYGRSGIGIAECI